ncbi:MAG: hypothetical protein D6776_05365 [Planctomycetota bacterium]|nr:MAG: hypothetical protein D6776_05365 [Planctomycetota bacterium]
MLEALVDRYDLEPGVRRLRRLITTIFRRVGAQIALGERPPGEFSHHELEPLLGPPAPETVVGSAQRRAEVGRAAGLARTVEGGRVTWVEALQAEPAHTLPAFPTGVRAEALAAAFAFVRSHAQQLRVDPDSLRPERVRVGLASPTTLDESARAGLDLAALLALASLASDRPVRPDVAAVGGLTLRGELTPIEGLPEMVLAAGRCGIRTVLVPAVSHGALVRALSPSTLAGLRLVAVDTAAEAARRSLIDIVIARGIESESA